MVIAIIFARSMAQEIVPFVVMLRPGTLGCTASHVHANIVARQLHIILKTARPSSLHVVIQLSSLGDDDTPKARVMGRRIRITTKIRYMSPI